MFNLIFSFNVLSRSSFQVTFQVYYDSQPNHLNPIRSSKFVIHEVFDHWSQFKQERLHESWLLMLHRDDSLPSLGWLSSQITYHWHIIRKALTCLQALTFPVVNDCRSSTVKSHNLSDAHHNVMTAVIYFTVDSPSTAHKCRHSMPSQRHSLHNLPSQSYCSKDGTTCQSCSINPL